MMLRHATRIYATIGVTATVLAIAPMRFSAALADPIAQGSFNIQLAADKAVYGVGDVIKLSLTITNNTSQTYSFFSRPPSALTDLRILDQDGRTLSQPPSIDRAAFFGGLANYKLRPGASVSPKYFYQAQPPRNGLGRDRWVGLPPDEAWHIHDLCDFKDWILQLNVCGNVWRYD